ncbi:DNA/RNA helicase domain-containing protein [Pseudophaeobacter leonis]|uniref:DNA/RNA helicase domain-containing protein n=1 Tax=Pseudophaeobacter leonis TaxID=1144477 RepID=UPI0019D32639|nr:DNA/RNA helicase domain-containing protein [Pseudophaeobacter leonis]
MSDAYYNSSIPDFVNEAPEAILGKLTLRHHHELEHQQRKAWCEQIRILQDQFLGLLHGHLFFELIIPRMGKRADCVVILSDTIFVIEFKVGSTTFDRHAIDQVHDYALDLKNFHLGSHNVHIVPILVATNAKSDRTEVDFAADCVATPLLLGSTEISVTLLKVANQSEGMAIDCDDWQASGYHPTPTIIQAAQALYQKHDVEEISRSDAGAKNLQSTSRLISEIIEASKREGRKSICFVTGVPGAGKTLAGLNIATSEQRVTRMNTLYFCPEMDL